MPNRPVQVLYDIHCSWGKVEPRYRVFVNEELFTERTWIWRDVYLEECLQIEAPPGRYQIRIDFIDESDACRVKIKNPRIDSGSASIDQNLTLEIY